MTSKRRNKRKLINKHSKKVYNRQQRIDGVKYKKLENQFLAINKSNLKTKMF